MRCADFKMTSGLILDLSGRVPFSAVDSWIYRRTSFFSRGITIILPESALCIAHLIRMSGKSVIGTTSNTPQIKS